MPRPFILAQFSDLHLTALDGGPGGIIKTNAAFSRAVARLAAFVPAPGALLITGDLTESGEPEAYDDLRNRLAPLSLPIYVIPGNHDDRSALRRRLDPAWQPSEAPYVQYAVDLGPIRLVALDTVEPGESAGLLDDVRLGWLESALAACPERPTVLAMHHPPIDTGIAFMDRIGLVGRERLADLLAGHPQVERVICGHVHRNVQTRFAGTTVSICPGTAHQVFLDLNGDHEDSWVPEPPAFQLHAWVGGRLVTHTVPIDNAGPPRSFGAG